MEKKILDLADYLDCNGPELLNELRNMGLVVDTQPITRVEVIDHSPIAGEGRVFTQYYDKPVKVENSIQDESRTLKIFISWLYPADGSERWGYRSHGVRERR